MSRKNKQITQLPGNEIMVKGRVKCECQAQVHGLVNNCTMCGRVVCKQEGAGPCFFCGNKVLDKLKEAGLQTDSELMFPDLIKQDQYEYEKAVQHKNKLLDYHKRDIHQSSILDDQTDYYQIADNVWESAEVRTKAVNKIIEKEEKIEEASQGINIQFDPLTKQFIEGESTKFDEDQFREQANQFQQEVAMDEYKKKVQQVQKDKLCIKVLNDVQQVQGDGNQMSIEKLDIIVDDRVFHNHQSEEIYTQIRDEIKLKSKPVKQPPPKPILCTKVQNDDFFQAFQHEVMQSLKNVDKEQKSQYDKEFFDLTKQDSFACISMLQPWASLMVEGFKRVEGRFWTTQHRGPLWVHAGATPPGPGEVQKLEEFYDNFYKDCPDRPQFPTRYPTGAIIGVVDLIGILTKEKYNQLLADEQKEESDTEFKFIIRNPRKLFYPISLRGQQNIFFIDQEIRNTAVKILQRVPTGWAKHILEDYEYEDVQMNEPQLTKVAKSQKEQFEEAVRQVEEDQESKQISYMNDQKVNKVKPIQCNIYSETHYQVIQLEKEQLILGQGASVDQEFSWGFVMKDLLSSSELVQVAHFLDSKIPQQKSKALLQTNMKVTNAFPHIPVILAFTERLCKETNLITDKSQVQRQFSYITVYFLKASDKQVTLESNVFCLMVLGCKLQLNMGTTPKTIITLQQGKALIIKKLDSTIKVSFSKEETVANAINEIGQDYNYKSWILVFSQN